jgi:hypothetical protein
MIDNMPGGAGTSGRPAGRRFAGRKQAVSDYADDITAVVLAVGAAGLSALASAMHAWLAAGSAAFAACAFLLLLVPERPATHTGGHSHQQSARP